MSMPTFDETKSEIVSKFPNAHFVRSGDWSAVYFLSEDEYFSMELPNNDIAELQSMGYEMHQSWIIFEGHPIHTYSLKWVKEME